MSEKGYYRYLVDDFGGCDYFEGIGNSFAILFDIADDLQKKIYFKKLPGYFKWNCLCVSIIQSIFIRRWIRQT
ncbi:MAG: hypothetical protein L6V93_02025 [Clostridiales bacterium]|nr:MAG: hypothetical protein L6V93_02025 [Clostridiales bacterium]